MQPPEEAVRTSLLALLVTRHEQAVKAARSDAIAPRGTAASRKRHFAWRAAEAAFAESIAEFVSSAGRARARERVENSAGLPSPHGPSKTGVNALM
jgi:Tfp pilus assembly protein PilX